MTEAPDTPEDEEITEAMDDCWRYFLPRVDPLSLWSIEALGLTLRESQIFSILYRSGKISGESFGTLAPDLEDPRSLLAVFIKKIREKFKDAGDEFEIETIRGYYRLARRVRLDMAQLVETYSFRRPDNNAMPWTGEDDDNLIWMVGQRTPVWIAMASLGRTERAILDRITHLGITESKTRRIPAWHTPLKSAPKRSRTPARASNRSSSATKAGGGQHLLT